MERCFDERVLKTVFVTENFKRRGMKERTDALSQKREMQRKETVRETKVELSKKVKHKKQSKC